MTTAIKPDDYAVGNYPAGADPWATLPRALEMTGSEKADGATPGTPVGARFENGRERDHYRAQSLLALRAVQQWDRERLTFDTGGRNVRYKFLANPQWDTTLKQEALVALGQDGNDGDNTMFVRSRGGTFETAINDPGSSDLGFCSSPGAPGEFLLGTNTGVISYLDLGNSSASHIVSFTPCALHYERVSGTYITANATDGSFDVGTDLTSMSHVATALATSFATGSIGTPGGEFASDGLGNVVFAAKSVVSAVDVFRLFYSADNGATWAIGKTFGAGLTFLNVVYIAASSTFFALASDGTTWTSANGSGWVAGTTVTGLSAASGGRARHGTMAVAGHCIAKIILPTLFGVEQPMGVAYSFDTGLTWRAHFFQEYDLTYGSAAYSLIASANRFYAIDGVNVYRSGVLAYEDADVT